jgi:Flp pilus assembly protein TadD
VMYLVNDQDSAERFLQRSLAINEMDPLTHLHLGQVYLQAGRNQEARDHLNQAIALSSDDAFRQTVLRQLNQIPSGLP